MNIGASLLDRGISRFIFGTPTEMTAAEIEEVVRQFAAAAELAYESGFKGIQLHAAHGYLLCQFLSPASNIRTDAYGGTAAKRVRIVIEIIRAIRAVVPNTFCVGIKLNSADVKGAENLEESLEQVALIAAEQIDFLEISGGSLENPRMATGDNSPSTMRTTKREAFFLDYAKAVRERCPRLLLMVTGGFRTRKAMQSALDNSFCDLIGLGRPSAAWPHLPKDIILNASVQEEDAQVHLSVNQPPWLLKLVPIKLIGFGADVVSFPSWF
jgi:2,4-dienoyl-CoA reductase-like NADH-dependent reductase (Old Yellow Enzyme family)